MTAPVQSWYARGPRGEQGFSVTSATLDGDDLVLARDGEQPELRVELPSLAAASQAAAAAAGSASAAAGSAGDAAGHAASAQSSASAADTSATAAAGSATAAHTAATEAAGSATNAGGSASQAADSASAAAGSAAAAAGSESAAAGVAGSVADAATAANNAKDAAELAASNASSAAAAAVAVLVDGAPEALDTFAEVAAAIALLESALEHASPDLLGTIQGLLASKVDKTITITAGTGLAGGGDLAQNRSLAAEFGNTPGTICQGNDGRLSDTRTPTNASVTTPKIVDGAVTADKLAFTAVTNSDPRLSDTRAPTNGSVSYASCDPGVQASLDRAESAVWMGTNLPGSGGQDGVLYVVIP